ncbi:aldose 1-epimerase family protein [Pseudarthrobacter oxydans]|uniref:aldose 1-epimerase family protein n=1 Tax=Pseudarthrobacter oxydans TaxID=1671 RepID=UPI003D268FB4
MTEYRIRSGEYTAAVETVAGALRELHHRGRDLIVPFPEDGPIPDYRGIIAAPWPNRIADGRYTFDGSERELAINEPERDCSLHGLSFSLDWTLVSLGQSEVKLSCMILPTAGYPHTLRIEVHYVLSDAGLHSSVTAENLGGNVAPYGVCPHPYLLAGPAPLDDWTLEIPARTFLQVTPERLLPTNLRPLEGHPFDFRKPAVIGAVKMDHAFTDITFQDGRARLLVRDPGGSGVGMAWDRECQWLQIYTGDKEPPSPNRFGLAVEPMTCPPNAFNSGVDLIRLDPGARHQAGWSIFAI